MSEQNCDGNKDCQECNKELKEHLKVCADYGVRPDLIVKCSDSPGGCGKGSQSCGSGGSGGSNCPPQNQNDNSCEVKPLSMANCEKKC